MAVTDDGRQFGAVCHLRHQLSYQRVLLAVAVVSYILLRVHGLLWTRLDLR